MNKEIKFKNSLNYLFTFSLSLVMLFAVLVMPFFFNGYHVSTEFGSQKEFVTIDGYGAMGLWSNGYAGIILSIIQIGVFIICVAMLVVSIFGILREYDIVEFSDSKSFSILKINKSCLIVIAILNSLALIFSIITIVTNRQVSQTGYFGFAIGSGSIVACIASVSMLVVYLFLERKGKINYSHIGNAEKVVVSVDGVSSSVENEIIVDDEK